VPRADPEVACLEWRPPAGLVAVLALNAVIAASLGAGFLAAALSEAGPAALYLACALGGIAGGVWLARMAVREAQARLVADRTGIALGMRGRTRYGWSEIDGFEVGALFDEPKAGHGHCGVMVLRDGKRVGLQALRTDAPLRGCERDEIRESVDKLNALHHARRADAAVLESGAPC